MWGPLGAAAPQYGGQNLECVACVPGNLPAEQPVAFWGGAGAPQAQRAAAAARRRRRRLPIGRSACYVHIPHCAWFTAPYLPSSPPPGPRSRAQQINELMVAQPHCRPTNPDRSLLEVGVRLQDGTLTSLRISLPPGFPGDRPALSITSPVRHPWVDAIGRLAFPLLDRWGAPNVRLAAVVADAFKGLGGTPAPAPSRQGPPSPPAGRPQQPGQHPPPSAQASAASLGGACSGPASLSPAPSGSSAPGGGAGQPQRARPVPIPATFAEVGQMSEEQLARLLSDGEAYAALVAQLATSLNLWQARGGGGQCLCAGRRMAAAGGNCIAWQHWPAQLVCSQARPSACIALVLRRRPTGDTGSQAHARVPPAGG